MSHTDGRVGAGGTRGLCLRFYSAAMRACADSRVPAGVFAAILVISVVWAVRFLVPTEERSIVISLVYMLTAVMSYRQMRKYWKAADADRLDS